ncbi:hypothetical protein FOCC_FOCC014189, partial [Frankliniella occidentalis]
MFLDPVSPQELLAIINNLKNKTSAGIDEISNVLLKKIGPNCLKNSKVVPLFKKGDKTAPDNYRSLRLTSNVAKVYEKAFYKRLVKFTT